MPEDDEGRKLERLIHEIVSQSTLLRWWPLAGGVSAQTIALEMALPDSRTRKLIVRRYGSVTLRQNPHIAADEARLLQTLRDVGLAVPEPCYVDESGVIFSTPYLVLNYVEGTPQFASDSPTKLATELAAYLVRIHEVDLSIVDLAFLSRQESGFGPRPKSLDVSMAEGRIRDALESLWPLPRLNEPVLLHGDFWPGNVLWTAGEISAVIDWEDARLGDPLADVGNSRLEILWAYGLDAMDAFTQQYRFLMPAVDFANLPYWDLCAALRPASVLSEWGLAPAREAGMRELHRWFVERALEGR